MCSLSENDLRCNELGKGKKIYYFTDFLVKDNHTAIGVDDRTMEIGL